MPVAPAPAAAPGAARRAPSPSAPEALVSSAVRALRLRHDPERASVLLDDYLRSHPDGALAEEATALAIEAAGARDPDAAGRFSRRYLERWPTGRFAAAARSVLQRGARD
jgi:hypothetical protein